MSYSEISENDHIIDPLSTLGFKAVVALGFGRFIHYLLDCFLGSLPDHFEAQIAAG